MVDAVSTGGVPVGMRIGLAVDGQAEVASLPSMRDRLNECCDHTIVFPPILVPMNANVPAPVVASECAARAGILVAKRIDLLVVLLDREDSQECCGVIAAAIEEAIAKTSLSVPASVVVKNSMFENWLLADLDALAASPGRFTVTSALRGKTERNKADNVAALREIGSAVAKGSYNKVGDAKIILSRADPLRMSAHSRSFRKFLRIAGAPAYRGQSRRPA